MSETVGLCTRLNSTFRWPHFVLGWFQDASRRILKEHSQLPAWIFKLCASILGWYISSILLTLFNKLIWSKVPEARENTATIISLQSAVMTTVIFVLWLLNYIDLSFANCRNVLLAFLPIAALACLDIAATNAAYSYVTVSVVVVVKSAIPFLTYIIGVLFGLVLFSLRKMLCLIWIAVTVSLTVTEMNIEETAYCGIVLSLLSVMAAALRWTLTHILLKGSPAGSAHRWSGLKYQIEPFQLVAIQQPLILFSSITFAIMHDHAGGLVNDVAEVGVAPNAHSLEPANEWMLNLAWWMALYAAFSSALAFAVVISEMYIIKYTDSTALTVCGVGKEVLVLITSHLIFADKVNIWSTISIGLTLLGLLCYAYLDRIISLRNHEADILAHYDDYPGGEIHFEHHEDTCGDVAVVILDTMDDYKENNDSAFHFSQSPMFQPSTSECDGDGDVAENSEFFSVSRLNANDYLDDVDAGEDIPSYRRMMPSSPMMMASQPIERDQTTRELNGPRAPILLVSGSARPSVSEEANIGGGAPRDGSVELQGLERV